MGERGPLPLPDNVRQLRGSPPAKERRIRPVPGIPNPPTWLKPEAKAEWKRVTPELHRLGVLAMIDRAVLTTYCDAWGKWVLVSRKIDEEGLTRRGDKGVTVKHPAMQLYRDLSTQIASLAKELGLSPNARGRMKAPEPEDDADPSLD